MFLLLCSQKAQSLWMNPSDWQHALKKMIYKLLNQILHDLNSVL